MSIAQDIRDAFANRDLDALDEALRRLERMDAIREQEIARLRGEQSAPAPELAPAPITTIPKLLRSAWPFPAHRVTALAG